MPGRVAEAWAVLALATIVTLTIAAPVLRAPSERLFGMEIVGRHHDPFSVMANLVRPIAVGMYSQPVTDIPGALFARLFGPVAGYNLLVLVSFPLSAAASFLLARFLGLSRTGAVVAAMAYAFSPFHLAQAAYHPHIAQTQWIPLYLLALWRCLDAPSPAAVGLLGFAALAVALSNFYGGAVAAVITPIAVLSHWVVTRRTQPQPMRRLGITAGSLAIAAATGIAYAWYAARAVVVNPEAFAFPRSDLFRYSAKWWSYLIPPVEHPLLGAAARRVWGSANVSDGLLEQQLSLGWGIVALGFIAIAGWLVHDRQRLPLARAPVLVVVAATALVCSLSPERTIGPFTVPGPSALLYGVAPMFRSYARFGVVVQLMAALLAGMGIDWLRRAGTRRAQVVWVGLAALALGEYMVSPAGQWRDVLPTTAHRWVAEQPGPMRVLDCTPLTQESESVQWLTAHRVTLMGSSTNDCDEPNLSQKLAAIGYTHLLVRHAASDRHPPPERAAPDGLRVAGRFRDGNVFAVTAHSPALYTATLTGFFPRERDTEWTWRWMGTDAAWTIVNPGVQAIVATLEVELSAFHRARHLELRLDGLHVQTLVVEPSRGIHRIGPIAVQPGGHELVFHPVEAPTLAGSVIDNSDGRRLSFAVGAWSWAVPSEPW